MKNTLTVIAKIRAAMGKGDRMAEVLLEQIPIVKLTEPGNLAYCPHRSVDDPDLFMFYEQYEDEEAFKAHGESSRLDDFRRVCAEERLTEGPVDDAVKVELFRTMAN